MKFNRQTFRSLALGFLVSAVVTSAFGLFYLNSNPIQGTNGISLMSGTQTAIVDQTAQVEELESQKASLEETQNSLNASINSMKEMASKQSSELASLKKASSSSKSDSSGESTASADESTTNTDEADGANTVAQTGEGNEANVGAEQTNTTAPAAVSGTFTVLPGETSDEIAYRLEAEGFANAGDFLAIVDYWDLSTILQAGSFQLDSNMNVNTIAEILTSGVYYWQP